MGLKNLEINRKLGLIISTIFFMLRAWTRFILITNKLIWGDKRLDDNTIIFVLMYSNK